MHMAPRQQHNSRTRTHACGRLSRTLNHMLASACLTSMCRSGAACVTAGILASALLGIIVIALIMRRQRRRAAQGELIGKQSIPSSGASSHHTTGTVTPVSPAAFSAMELGGAVPFAARPPLGSGPGVSSPTTRPTTPGTPQDYPLWMWTAQPPVSVSPYLTYGTICQTMDPESRSMACQGSA